MEFIIVILIIALIIVYSARKNFMDNNSYNTDHTHNANTRINKHIGSITSNYEEKKNFCGIIIFLYGIYTNNKISSLEIDRWISKFCDEFEINDQYVSDSLNDKMRLYAKDSSKIIEDISYLKSNSRRWESYKDRLSEMLMFGINNAKQSNDSDMTKYLLLLFMSCSN